MAEVNTTTISIVEFLEFIELEKAVKAGKVVSYYSRGSQERLYFYSPTEIMEGLTKANADLLATYSEIRNKSDVNKSLLDRANREIERISKMSLLEFRRYKHNKQKT